MLADGVGELAGRPLGGEVVDRDDAVPAPLLHLGPGLGRVRPADAGALQDDRLGLARRERGLADAIEVRPGRPENEGARLVLEAVGVDLQGDGALLADAEHQAHGPDDHEAQRDLPVDEGHEDPRRWAGTPAGSSRRGARGGPVGTGWRA